MATRSRAAPSSAVASPPRCDSAGTCRMTPVLLKRPQPSGNSVSPLVKAAKPNLEPRLTHHLGLIRHLRLSLRPNVPAGGWRRFGGPPPASCGGWWDQIGDRTRRPDSIVCRSGYLRSGPNNRSPRKRPSSLCSRTSARLCRLSRAPSLPGRVERHLPHLPHAVFRGARDHQRLVDPRLKLVQRRNRSPGYDPVVSDVPLRPLDGGNLRSGKAENPTSD
jgi:hypothetical protein